jgi:iron complex outermembrane receptor protein
LSALARASYYGAVTFRAEDPANDEHFGGKTLYDLELSYRFHPAVQLTIGADNVLNTFPDRQKNAANINAGRFIYSRNVSQFGLTGGFYYSRLQLSWL